MFNLKDNLISLEQERTKLAKELFGNDFEPIILFLSDTDLYKITMQQIIYHRFHNVKNTEFRFKCRNKGINLAQFVAEINRQLDWVCTLKYAEFELNYIKRLSFIKEDFVEFLENFKLNRKNINVYTKDNGEIDIITNGSWLQTIPFELIVLPIINELYFRQNQNEATFEEGRKRLQAKINSVKELNDNKFKFSDFGTRRRFSRIWQEEVVVTLLNELPNNFSGTSNIFLAMKYDIKPIGTMAHEYLQAAQAIGPRLRDSQKFALENWVQEYRGELGIALTDVVGTEAFLKDFDLYFAKIYDGVRHDSGDPYVWSNLILNHYKKLGIDPTVKTLVYSDGLNFEKSFDLFKTFKNQALLFFGIGTNLTNDLGITTLNIVMKMLVCDGLPVAKISDDNGKVMSNNDVYINYLKYTYNIAN